jgi:hypothetical protein
VDLEKEYITTASRASLFLLLAKYAKKGLSVNDKISFSALTGNLNASLMNLLANPSVQLSLGGGPNKYFAQAYQAVHL